MIKGWSPPPSADQGLEAAMEERLDRVVVFPAHQFEGDFAQVVSDYARLRVAIQHQIDRVAAARQSFRHPKETDLRHRRKRQVGTAIAMVNARDSQRLRPLRREPKG